MVRVVLLRFEGYLAMVAIFFEDKLKDMVTTVFKKIPREHGYECMIVPFKEKKMRIHKEIWLLSSSIPS